MGDFARMDGASYRSTPYDAGAAWMADVAGRRAANPMYTPALAQDELLGGRDDVNGMDLQSDQYRAPRTYTVQRGDNPASIGRAFFGDERAGAAILAANGLNASVRGARGLQIGQVLTLPDDISEGNLRSGGRLIGADTSIRAQEAAAAAATATAADQARYDAMRVGAWSGRTSQGGVMATSGAFSGPAMVSRDIYTAMGDYAGSEMVPVDNRAVRDPVGEAVTRIGSGALRAVALGIAELPLQVADMATAGYNVLRGTNYPVNNSMLGQLAASGAGTGELLWDVAKNTASLNPLIGVGRASFNGTQALMAGDLEGVGAGLAGVGGSFALGSAMGYGRVGLEFGELSVAGPGGLQRGAINLRLYDVATRERILENFRFGNEFEAQARTAAGVEKNYSRIYGTGDLAESYAIPDAKNAGRIVEMKDVHALSRDQQFQIYEQSRRPVDLIISPKTQYISTPLIDSIRANNGSISIYNPSTGNFHPYDFASGAYSLKY
jgi:hypothetical protein